MRWSVVPVFLLVALATCAQRDGMAKREAKARAQLARDKPYKAISLCNGALGLEERPVFYVLRADARNRIGEFAMAEGDARKALATVPADREARLQLAIAEQGLGRNDSAIMHYKRLIAEDDDPGIRYRLATTLQAERDYAGALYELDAAMGWLAPDDPARARFLRTQGECRALAGDTAWAREVFQRALEAAPEDPITYNSRAWFLHAAYGEHAKAIADYDRAIKHNPNYSYAFNNRGWSRYKMGDVTGALKDIHLAKRKKPFNPYIYRNLGVIALERGDVAEACGQFRRAQELNFTSLYGDEVQRLLLEHCRDLAPEKPAVTPVNAPDAPKRTPPADRTNAP